MAISSLEKEFVKLVDVNSPIIYIQDWDFWRIDKMIADAISQATAFEWNPSEGCIDFRTKVKKGADGIMPLYDFLKEFYDTTTPAKPKFLILKDVHNLLDDDSILSLLHLMAQRRYYDTLFNTTVVIIDNIINIPSQIIKYVSILEVEFPDDDEIDELINEHARVNGYSELNEKDRIALKPTLKGLSMFDIDRLLDYVMSSNGDISAEDKEMLLKQKKNMVRKAGLLELVDTAERIDDIGGLENLKEYLKKKEKVFKNWGAAQNRGVEAPKGVFILGLPGCGKSLCAKAAATLFEAPLLKLDMGSMMGKYVGESESNLREAIKIAEAAAPCVLWLDEIEKAFAGVNGDGGGEVITRMFGYFLSWMQDKQSLVYVVATANRIEGLPTELLRKGRFDELFFVNLPNLNEIKEIFKIHLNKGGRKNCDKDFEIDKLNDSFYRKFEGCNGADIESIIKEAIENAFIENKKLSQEGIERVKNNTKSIKESFGNKLKDMEDKAKEYNFRAASHQIPINSKNNQK